MNRHIKNGMLSMGVWILFLVVLFGSYMTFTDSPFSDLLDEETGGFISGAFFLAWALIWFAIGKHYSREYELKTQAFIEKYKGFDENVYLDAATRTKIEETGGANLIFITKDGKFVTPKSNSILPSITRRSLEVVAKDYLGIEVEERKINKNELADFAECGLCGTAAVISPIGKIVDHGTEINVPSGMEEIGPVLKKLRETLTGIQMGEIKAPEGWIYEIK